MVGILQESLSMTVYERPYLASEVVSRRSPHHKALDGPNGLV